MSTSDFVEQLFLKLDEKSQLEFLKNERIDFKEKIMKMSETISGLKEEISFLKGQLSMKEQRPCPPPKGQTGFGFGFNERQGDYATAFSSSASAHSAGGSSAPKQKTDIFGEPYHSGEEYSDSDDDLKYKKPKITHSFKGGEKPTFGAR